MTHLLDGPQHDLENNKYRLAEPVGDPAIKPIVMLRAPVPDVNHALAAAAQRLAERGGGTWELTREDPNATEPFAIAVQLSLPGTGRADAITSAPGVTQVIDQVRGLNAVLDPMLIGAPAYKPHALTRGDFGRIPTAVVGAPPPRAAAGRRPVVALLDTEVADHDWLGGPDRELGGRGFWVDAATVGWNPGRRLTISSADEPLELPDFYGHGTFAAGLVRQVAPDVQVLSVRVMNDDGLVYGDHVLNALEFLRSGWDGHPAPLRKGDVICLPFGFRPVLPADRRYLHWLGRVLSDLAAEGIKVVAAAGNDSRSDPVYPAAFVPTDGIPDGMQVRAVGAVNTPGTQTLAWYSNYGTWVTETEVGTSLVSAFPRVNRSAAAEFSSPDPARASVDPDDFSTGFARWSGTSFAAAIYAAKLAAGQIR